MYIYIYLIHITPFLALKLILNKNTVRFLEGQHPVAKVPNLVAAVPSYWSCSRSPWCERNHHSKSHKTSADPEMNPTKHNWQQIAVDTETRGGSGHRLMDPAAAARSRPPPVLRCLTWRPVEVSSKIWGINCENFSQSKVQRGHLYQNEPRARLNSKHETSRHMIQPSQIKVTQRCLDTCVIVTAHKQVCANQQIRSGIVFALHFRGVEESWKPRSCRKEKRSWIPLKVTSWFMKTHFI